MGFLIPLVMVAFCVLDLHVSSVYSLLQPFYGNRILGRERASKQEAGRSLGSEGRGHGPGHFAVGGSYMSVPSFW